MDKLDIIVLTGKKFSGKDTLASVLTDRKRVAFGDQHKRACSELFPFLEEDYPSELKEQPILPGGLSPRDIWVKMNILTEIYPRFSVDKLQSQIMDLSSEHSRFVITDLRQEHEYEWVVENSIPIIKIVDATKRDVKEDRLEDFIDHIKTPYTFHNNKTASCKRLFKDYVELVLWS